MQYLLSPVSAALATLALAMPSSAATFVVWQGEAVILTATPQCSADASERTKIGKGTVLKSVVRPAGLASNGSDSRIAFLHDSQSEFALDLAGGLTIAGTGTYAAFGVTTSGLLMANVGGNYSAFALAPASPKVTTVFLKLTGSVDNFMFINGCTVSFRAGYSLRS